MRATDITLEVFEKYKPEELAEVAKQMAQAQGDLETVETEKKLSDGAFNERIKQHAATVSDLAKKYNKGGETAQIGCTIRYDIPEVGKKSYIRHDTEETVEVRDMDFSEKQETLQFPLTAAATEEKPADDVPPINATESAPAEAAATEEKPAEITFKDIQAIAAHILNLPAMKRDSACREMQKSISWKLLQRGTVIGPDGRLETIDSPATADKLAEAWLKLAQDEATAPPPKEEVTKICPYPGCILFAEHDGSHEFLAMGPKGSEPITPEAQPQPEKKTRRKKRDFAPPPDETTQPGAPTA